MMPNMMPDIMPNFVRENFGGPRHYPHYGREVDPHVNLKDEPEVDEEVDPNSDDEDKKRMADIVRALLERIKSLEQKVGISAVRSSRGSEADQALYEIAREELDIGVGNMTEFIQEVKDVDMVNSEGKTMVHLAAQFGGEVGVGALESLLFLGDARLNVIDNEGRSPLHMAAENNDTKMVDFLLDISGVEFQIDFQDNTGSTAYDVAISDAIRTKIRERAETPYFCNKECPEPITYEATKQGLKIDVGGVVDRFKKDLDINETDSNGRTMLHWAAEYDRSAARRQIFRNLDNPKALSLVIMQDKGGYTAYDIAVGQTKIENDFGRQIRQTYALPSIDAGGSLYCNHRCISSYETARRDLERNSKMIDIYIKAQGKDIDLKDSAGKTMLHWAAHYGRVQAVEKLLKHGAKLNEQDYEGKCALYWAAKFGHFYVVEMLMTQTGLKLGLQDNDGNTAFDIAALGGQSEVADYIKANADSRTYTHTLQPITFEETKTGLSFDDATVIDRYVTHLKNDIDQKDGEGKTMLIWAAEYGRVSACDKLMKNEANPNVQDNEGETALYYAATLGKNDVVNYLLNQNDVSLKLQDKDGLTAYDAAISTGQFVTANLLLDKAPGFCNTMCPSKLYEEVRLELEHGLADTVLDIYINQLNGDVNEENSKGKTLLHYAAEADKLDMVKALMAKKDIKLD